MDYYAIGDVLRDARRRHGLTQEELAFGICSVSTLSKIETGKQMPHCRTFEALMQRMGEPEKVYICRTDKWNLERKRLIEKIEHELRLGDEARVRELLEKYDAVPGKENVPDLQWRKLAEASLRLWNGAQPLEILMELNRIISMTRPDFTGGWMPQEMYTHCEFLTFQMAAQCFWRTGEFVNAQNILMGLGRYLQGIQIGGAWAGEAEISLCHQTAELYFCMGKYASSAGFCTGGIRKCLEQERYHFLSILLAQRACIMAELGDTSESHLADYHAGLFDEIRTNQNYLSKFL